MLYLIDANNLAGKMKILKIDNFDRILIGLIKAWPKLKSNRVTLVFDPLDMMGDKDTQGNLTVIYARRDEHYSSADDKIIELVEEYVYRLREAKIMRDELTVITDDLKIKNRITEIGHPDIRLKSSVWLAEKLMKLVETEEADPEEGAEDGRRGLGGDAIDKINDELKKIWR